MCGGDAGALKLGGGGIKVTLRGSLERDRVIVRFPHEIHQRVVTVVALAFRRISGSLLIETRPSRYRASSAGIH